MAAPIAQSARLAVQITFYDADDQPWTNPPNAGFVRVIVRNGVTQVEFGNKSGGSVLAFWSGQGWKIAPGDKFSGYTYASFTITPVVVQ